MKESVYSLSEFLLRKDDGRSTIRLFTAKPTPLEEKNLGQVFAIMEIESIDSMNEHVLDVLATEINTHYYKSEALEFDNAFEYALQQANTKVQELVGEIGEEWLHNFNVVVGARKGSDVVFTHIGRVIAQMVHNNSISDVLDTTASKMQTVNPVRAFGSVMSGRLTQSSILFFSTETILDYLSKEKIKRVLNADYPKSTAADAIESFYELLQEDTSTANFGAVIVQHEEREVEAEVPTAEEATTVAAPVQQPQTTRPAASYAVDTADSPKESPSTQTSNDSINTLVHNQQKTEELLSGSIWPGVKQSLKDATRKKNGADTTEADEEFSDDILDTPTAAPRKKASATDEHVAMTILKKLWVGLQTVLVFVWNVLQSIFALVAGGVQRVSDSRSGRTPRPAAKANRKPGQAVAAVFAGAIKWFSNLSVIQKSFFVIAIVVLIIFANSVSNRGERKIATENEEQYSQTVAEIDLKINEGKAAIIFDSETSRTLLLEARELLNSIPTDSEVYTARGEELQGVIAEQLLVLNNVITVDNPTVAVDYSTVNADVQVSHVIQLGSSMYGFDQSNQSVYRGNLESGETSVAISSSVGPLYSEVVKASPGTGIAILSDQTVATFQPISESIEPIELEYENTENAFADVAVFGTRLYTLDTRNNQIFRHTGTDGTFGAAEGWITDGSGVANGVSLAIDGAIYVLRDDATVSKFSAGAEENGFALATVDPALTSAQQIITDENTENLYVIDRNNSRVVVFDKNGGFVAQYTSGQFNNISDLIIDEANGKMYVLSGAKLYEVTLSAVATDEDETE